MNRAPNKDNQAIKRDRQEPDQMQDETQAPTLNPGLKPDEAARILTTLRGIETTDKRLADWRFTGRGPKFIRRGRLVFYSREELEKWAEKEAKGEVWQTKKEIERAAKKEVASAPIDSIAPPAGRIFKLVKTGRDGVFRCPAGDCHGLMLVRSSPVDSMILPAVRAESYAEFWESTSEVVIWQRKTETLIRLELKPSEARCVVALVVDSKEFWRK